MNSRARAASRCRRRASSMRRIWIGTFARGTGLRQFVEAGARITGPHEQVRVPVCHAPPPESLNARPHCDNGTNTYIVCEIASAARSHWLKTLAHGNQAGTVGGMPKEQSTYRKWAVDGPMHVESRLPDLASDHRSFNYFITVLSLYSSVLASKLASVLTLVLTRVSEATSLFGHACI